jgi:ATP-dependent Clp protease ATP-binding subunit ClpC
MAYGVVLLGLAIASRVARASPLLHLLQVQADEVRRQIEALHPAEEQPVGDGLIGMTAQGKESIELAVQEARSLDHHYIGTEHLLLGLLRQEEGFASQVLRKSWLLTGLQRFSALFLLPRPLMV